MRLYKMIISMILIMGLIVGSVPLTRIEAGQKETKKVDVKNEKNLKITFLNENIDFRLEELVFKIKNTSKSKVKITRVFVQYEYENQWMNLECKNVSAQKVKLNIKPGNTEYGSIKVADDYLVSEGKMAAGKYSVYVKYKKEGQEYFQRRIFVVSGKENVTEVKNDIEETASNTGETTTETVFEETTYYDEVDTTEASSIEEEVPSYAPPK